MAVAHQLAVGQLVHLDEAGNIVRAWTDARPRKESGKFVPRPWGGVYSDLEVVAGIGIPTRAEVSWELPDGLFTWFRATITTLELGPPAAAGAMSEH